MALRVVHERVCKTYNHIYMDKQIIQNAKQTVKSSVLCPTMN